MNRLDAPAPRWAVSLIAVFAVGMAVLQLGLQSQNPEIEWWDAAWGYRTPVKITTGDYGSQDAPISWSVNLAARLAAMQEAGDTDPLDPTSVRVIEYEFDGSILEEVPSQFTITAKVGIDAEPSAELLWMLDGVTAPNTDRHFYVYFDSWNGMDSRTQKGDPGYTTDLTTTGMIVENRHFRFDLEYFTDWTVKDKGSRAPLVWGPPHRVSVMHDYGIREFADPPVAATLVEEGPVRSRVRLSPTSGTVMEMTFYAGASYYERTIIALPTNPGSVSFDEERPAGNRYPIAEASGIVSSPCSNSLGATTAFQVTPATVAGSVHAWIGVYDDIDQAGYAEIAEPEDIVNWGMEQGGPFSGNEYDATRLPITTWSYYFEYDTTVPPVLDLAARRFSMPPVLTEEEMTPTLIELGADLNVSRGETINFNGRISARLENPTFIWDFGDTTTSEGSLTPSHHYTEQGEHTVTLTVSTSSHGTLSDTLTVTVQTKPRVSTPQNSLPPTTDTQELHFATADDPAAIGTMDCTDDDGDGFDTCNGDCDDSDPDIYPGALEVCDGEDNDCDGTIDNGSTGTIFSMPDDAAGVPGATVTLPIIVTPANGVAIDLRIKFDPAVLQLTDVLKTSISDPPGPQDFFLTVTPDNFNGTLLISLFGVAPPMNGAGPLLNLEFTVVGTVGETSALDFTFARIDEGQIASCVDQGLFTVCDDQDDDGDGFSECDGDCDDSSATTFPGAASNDSLTDCMKDDDDDDYGDVTPPSGVAPGTDCDDATAGINPSASDANCNEVDDDCDGAPDDAYVPTPTTCGVGQCAGNVGVLACVEGTIGDTCDPLGGATAEICDGVDNDCNDIVDDGTSAGDIGNEVRFGPDPTVITWADVPNANVYNVYRGNRFSGVMFTYDHTCYEPESPDAQTEDTEIPPVGRVYYYLVSAVDNCQGEDTLGTDSTGAPRPNDNPCTTQGLD